MKWLLYIIGATLATYSVIGGITVRFQPAYIIIQMPNACTKGDSFMYAPPEQETLVDLTWELTNE